MSHGISTSHSPEMYKLKKTIRELKSKTGRGTELISLYVPPKKRTSDIISYLREEYGTATNIKSSITKKNVQDAITKTIEKLKSYAQAPDNGLVIFCGAIPHGAIGTEKLEIYVVIPPEPININLYRCDNKFHVNHIEDLLSDKELYGIVSIDVNDTAIALLIGNKLKFLSTHTSGIAGKHRAGGQSAKRFERLREIDVHEYFKRIAKYVNESFLDELYWSRISGIILGGPGLTKKTFVDESGLDYRISDKIIGYVDTNYSGKEGVREILSKSEDLLKTTRYITEKKLIDRFIKIASGNRPTVTYGYNETITSLKEGKAEIVLLLDNFKANVFTITCNNCQSENFIVSINTEYSLPQTCNLCNNTQIKIINQDILDYLEQMCELTGAKIEIINSSQEYGDIFKKLGGIGAFLRY